MALENHICHLFFLPRESADEQHPARHKTFRHRALTMKLAMKYLENFVNESLYYCIFCCVIIIVIFCFLIAAVWRNKVEYKIKPNICKMF